MKNTSYFFIPFKYEKYERFKDLTRMLDESDSWDLVHDEIIYMMKYVADKLDSRKPEQCLCFHYEWNGRKREDFSGLKDWFSTKKHPFQGTEISFRFQLIGIQLYCFSTSVCIMVFQVQFEKNDPNYIASAEYYLKKVGREKIFSDQNPNEITFLKIAEKLMREVDPTRPVCFDSNYLHKKATKRFGKDFVSTMDDGDIDDQHAYYNWYDFSLFRFFNGEFQRDFKSEGRPLISQEMSTGYPNNETGHPTRSYQLIHQNPFTLIGYDAYDWSDPNIFLKVQGFITGELAEALRRSNPEASGIMHFAYMTWLRQCYDAENIAPYPAWYAMQRAMQPVLVSAELWGRHFYAGSKISPRIYVVNDDVDGKNLHNLTLRWSIEDRDGKTMAAGSESMKDVPYYDRTYIAPTIKIPDDLPESRMDGCLHLVLTDGSGSAISENRYEITIASPEWIGEYATDGVKVIDGVKDFKPEYAQELRAYHDEGGKMLLLNCPELAKAVFPEYITGWQVPTEGDIVVMERPEADVFDGLDVLDLRYFNNNKREIPTACHSILHVKRNEHIEELASQMKIHAYLDDKNLEDRVQRIEAMRGLTLMAVDGHTFVSTMATDKASTDPVAGKLLANLVNKLNRR